MLRYSYPFKGGNRITTPFGKPGEWKCGWHIGVDLVGIGTKKIHPIAAGVVKSINKHGAAYGTHITIAHPDGTESLYAHMLEQYRKVGEGVDIDSLIGIMGATGNTKGAHLHLEIHKGGYRYPPKDSSPEECAWLLDPIKYLNEKIALYQEEEKMPDKVPEWQIKAAEEVCDKLKLTNKADWLQKVKNAETLTIGEMFAILNKMK